MFSYMFNCWRGKHLEMEWLSDWLEDTGDESVCFGFHLPEITCKSGDVDGVKPCFLRNHKHDVFVSFSRVSPLGEEMSCCIKVDFTCHSTELLNAFKPPELRSALWHGGIGLGILPKSAARELQWWVNTPFAMAGSRAIITSAAIDQEYLPAQANGILP